MLSGMSSIASLFPNSACLTESKALEKSIAIILTNGLEESRLVTVCKMVMSAEVVDPVGLKANWSEKVRVGGG